MNYWTEISIEYANQKSYLDDLFQVYPTIPDGIREIKMENWNKIEEAFNSQNNEELLHELLKFNLFPIKDSYVAFFKRDKSAIKRNPKTINRLCGRLYEMGLDKIFERCSEPKETNRQIGPYFKRWLNKKSLGLQPVNLEEFICSEKDAVLNGTDKELMDFASKELNYKHSKGLDFVARLNNKYVIGEAKFLTDFGGHQNAQFNDAIATMQAADVNATILAILDGVLYIKGNNKMYKDITTKYANSNIMSSLVLREFLYQL